MIHVQSLQFSFDPNRIEEFSLIDINLNVSKDSQYGILGLGGSGKSVFLKCIADIFKPQSGSVQLGDTRISMLFQQNALFDSMTVYENLFFPLNELFPHLKNKKDKVLEFLGHVGLQDEMDLYPSELSGGMKKRLGISRALIVEPAIVLYDEPTAGLDPVTAHSITEFIRDLNTKNTITSVIVSSDYLNIQKMCTEVGIMIPYKGGHTLRHLGKGADLSNCRDEFFQQFIQGIESGPLTV